MWTGQDRLCTGCWHLGEAGSLECSKQKHSRQHITNRLICHQLPTHIKHSFLHARFCFPLAFGLLCLQPRSTLFLLLLATRRRDGPTRRGGLRLVLGADAIVAFVAVVVMTVVLMVRLLMIAAASEQHFSGL